MPGIFTKNIIIKSDFPLGSHEATLNNVEAFFTKEGKPVLVLNFENKEHQQRAIFNSSNTEVRNEFRPEDFADYVLKPLSTQLNLSSVSANDVLEKAIGQKFKITVTESLVTDQQTGEVKTYVNLRIG